MWKRKDLKARAKGAFKRNYWKTVLVSLLLMLLVGGASGTVSSFSGNAGDNTGSSAAEKKDEQSINEETPEDELLDIEGLLAENSDVNDVQLKDSFRDMQKQMEETGIIAVSIIFVIIFVIVFIVVFAICAVFSAFVVNPLDVGCKRFFLRNLHEPAQVGNIGYAFDNNYKNIAKTMFFRDMYTFFWSLLFIIPGIVKAYEYRMIPYLLADNPQMTKEQAFAESKQMMKGQKWRTFVLDLSFIGWFLVAVLTLDIVGIFYVMPYVDETHAALYETLRYGNSQGTVNGNQEYV